MVSLAGNQIKLPAGIFAFKLFSSILVVYHNNKRKDTFNARVKKITITTSSGIQTINSSVIEPPLSYKIREKKVNRIDIYLS
jgi:hypothetical protein